MDEIKKWIHARLDGEIWRTQMRMTLSSRLIFTAIGVSLPIAAHRADMNETHIYNPDWPPHAKFHDGQTLSMSPGR
jgi:hypothetical protein